MAQVNAAAALATLNGKQQSHPLSILHLAEPLLEPQSEPVDSVARPSNASSSIASSNPAFENNPTPESLNADLAHYKDLFSKLRFSYLEQVTKEKYLRSIVGDPPLLVSHADNMVLEEKLGGMKADLKAKKAEVDQLVLEMEELARQLARKFDTINRDKAVLETVPREIELMQSQVEGLRQELAEKKGASEESSDPRLNMGLDATQTALEQQRQKNRELDAEIEALQRQLPARMRECEKAERELEELERRRNESAKSAREVRRIKEEGGRDVLGEQGRWYKSSEAVLNGLLGVEA